MSLTSPQAGAKPQIRAQHGYTGWRTVVWDDPINLRTYMSQVLQAHFGYTDDHAHTLMVEIHRCGQATVSHGSREHMEADVVAMHRYGLRATLEIDDT